MTQQVIQSLTVKSNRSTKIPINPTSREHRPESAALTLLLPPLDHPGRSSGEMLKIAGSITRIGGSRPAFAGHLKQPAIFRGDSAGGDGGFSPTRSGIMPATVPCAVAPIIYLIESDETLRSDFHRVLAAVGYEVRSFSAVVDFLLDRRGGRLECLVANVRMPEGPSGLELQTGLNRRGETLPIIFMADCGDTGTVVQAVKNGAFDFLSKPVAPASLLATVQKAVAAQEAVMAKDAIRRDLVSRVNSLAPREVEVFVRVVKGQLNRCIAVELGCSERTVKACRAQVMVKMGASSFANLVSLSKEIATS
jgi:FixJ family two-component response regulator